jgi:cytochrome bd ubiquinol oxidase subunit II
MENGRYVGGTFGWFSVFSLLCGVALCAGYTLIGLGWLIAKCEGTLRNKAYHHIRLTTLCVMIFLIGLFIYSLRLDLRILDRWTERPFLGVFPAVGLLAAAVLLLGKRDYRDHRPFIMMVFIFVAALGTFLVSFWPYMIPFALTIDEAAAPPSSLRFMFWGVGLFVFPLIAIYSAAVYKAFYGKSFHVVDERNAVADLKRRFDVDGDARKDVRQGVLQGKTEHDGHDTRGRHEPSDRDRQD